MLNWYLLFLRLVGISCLALIWLWLAIGQYIRRVRCSNNWTQEEFAERLGVDTRTVRRWENENVVPRERLLTQIRQLDPDWATGTEKLYETWILALLLQQVDAIAKNKDGHIELYQCKFYM